MSQNKSEETDDLFQPMKQAILEAVNQQHKWQNTAKKRLVNLTSQSLWVERLVRLTMFFLNFKILTLNVEFMPGRFLILFDLQSVIQKNALEDTAVTDKMQWDNSITFVEQILNMRINDAKDTLDEVIGNFRNYQGVCYRSLEGWRE